MSVTRTPLKRFQEDAVASGTAVLSACLDQLSDVRGGSGYARSRQLIVAENGYLLFEAPTGSGKTLMAAAVADALSARFLVLWFWFAPFVAIAGHAAGTIASECANLRPKDLTAGRDVETLAAGDLFATTWAAVATSNRESRRARTDTESLPSVDRMVEAARAGGLFIGAVVDEAHHGFRGSTQAYAFYRDVLAPDVTILATATPDDADLRRFVAAQGDVRLHRIGVSRLQAVEAGLLKQGVKVAVFRAPQDVAELVDFRRTALRAGVDTHRRIKRALAAAGIPVVPLLLVQVDSSDGSVAEAQSILRELGLGGDQVRTHTADEPDPHLLALAADETVEVLIFKMAVGLGFDCPRAYTLVSTRSSRDPDFGVQVVGRIMRVDRRMQGLPDVPEPLRYGYVILSDRDAQTGLLSAAERINAIRSELAQVSHDVTVLPLDGGAVARRSPGGSISLLPEEEVDAAETEPAQPGGPPRPISIFPGLDAAAPGPGPPPRRGAVRTAPYVYRLRDDLPFPRRLRRAQVAVDRQADLLADIVNLTRLDDEVLVLSRRDSAVVLMEQMEVFERRREAAEVVSAMLAQREIDRRAQRTLFLVDEYGMVDVRALQEALERRLADEYRSYSACLPLPGQPDFYPDFVVGIRDRRTPGGAALVEVKRVINEVTGNPQAKAAARHPEYGKVLMVYWRDNREWMVVELDDTSGRSVLDRIFRIELLRSY